MLKSLKNRLNDNKGFSLVELIVVIAIMVILIALLVPQVSGYIAKANATSASAAAKSVYTELVNQLADFYAGNEGDIFTGTLSAGTVSMSDVTVLDATISGLSDKVNAIDYTLAEGTGGALMLESVEITLTSGLTASYPACC